MVFRYQIFAQIHRHRRPIWRIYQIESVQQLNVEDTHFWACKPKWDAVNGKKWRVLNVCARETMNEHGFSRYETLCMCALFFYCVKYTKSCLFFVRLLSLYNVFVTFNIYTADRLGHFQKIEQHIQKDQQHDSYCFFCLRSILLVIVCPFFVLLLAVRFWHYGVCERFARINQYKRGSIKHKSCVFRVDWMRHTVQWVAVYIHLVDVFGSQLPVFIYSETVKWKTFDVFP